MLAAISQAFAYVSAGSQSKVEVDARPRLINPSCISLPVLTHSAISPVDAEPTYDFIPKDEIIRTTCSLPHLHFACRQTGAYSAVSKPPKQIRRRDRARIG